MVIGLRLDELKSEFIADFHSAPWFVGSIAVTCGLVALLSLCAMAFALRGNLTMPPYRPPLPPRQPGE